MLFPSAHFEEKAGCPILTYNLLHCLGGQEKKVLLKLEFISPLNQRLLITRISLVEVKSWLPDIGGKKIQFPEKNNVSRGYI